MENNEEKHIYCLKRRGGAVELLTCPVVKDTPKTYVVNKGKTQRTIRKNGDLMIVKTDFLNRHHVWLDDIANIPEAESLIRVRLVGEIAHAKDKLDSGEQALKSLDAGTYVGS